MARKKIKINKSMQKMENNEVNKNKLFLLKDDIIFRFCQCFNIFEKYLTKRSNNLIFMLNDNL